jgi:transcriptional regulator with XRE-family HTH domain
MIPIRVERDIRKLLKAGVSTSDVARASGVSRSTVLRVKSARSNGSRSGILDDLGILDATGKTIFAPPPWYLDNHHMNVIAIADYRSDIPWYCISSGDVVQHDCRSLWPIGESARKQANARLIVDSPMLFALAHDLQSLAALNIVDNQLFKQLATRATAILKRVRGTL